MVDFIMSYIREPALSVCQAHMKPNVPFTVDDLRTYLLTNYAPLHAEQQARQKLLRLQQRGSVESYGKLFMTLLAKLKTSPMAPADQVTQFLAGLKPQLKSHCSVKPNTLQPWDEVQELYRYCVLREQASGTDQNQPGSTAAASDSGWQSAHSRKKQRMNHSSSQGRSSSQGPSLGHTRTSSGINADERFSGKNLTYLLQNQLCFYCKKPGHSKQDCEDMKAGKPPVPLRLPPGWTPPPKKPHNGAKLRCAVISSQPSNGLRFMRLADEQMQQIADLTGQQVSMHANDQFPEMQLSDQHVWLHDLEGPALLRALQHYRQSKAQNAKLSGCFLVPRKFGPWRPLLKGMRMIRQYSAGKDVLWDLKAQQLTQLPLDMQLFYDAPVASSISVATASTGLRMHVYGKIAGSPAKILLDSDASMTYLSSRFMKLVGLQPQKAACPIEVLAYDGQTVTAEGTCKVKVQIGDYSGAITCTVVQCSKDFDLILGDSWLRKHHAHLLYEGDNIAHFSKGARQFTLQNGHIQSVNNSVSGIQVITAMQARRAMRTGDNFFGDSDCTGWSFNKFRECT